MIFPELNNDYKVRVSTVKFERGRIIDRNGHVLAGQGKVSNVGIVPGRLDDENKEASIAQIAGLLGVSVESINASLEDSWVKNDSFVPIKAISIDANELKEQLLQISGVMIDTVTKRVYPYKDLTSHITGYVQGITLEELSRMPIDSGYTLDSIIGKTGLEQVFEDRLKGTDGVKVYIEDSSGRTVKILSEIKKQDGEDIHITIDIDLQARLQERIQNDEGLFIVMDYRTGELLALISTPSYDANKFVLGMSEAEWNAISTDTRYPLYTRFTSRWCPGSTFKPLTAAIGLTSGKLRETDVFNYSGLSWKKSSWTNHRITTLTAYSGKKNLRNAIAYSDNIYFAQAVLQIGEEAFTNGLNKILFNSDVDFELPLSYSIYSNTSSIAGETILADSGYGQGEILVNPILMASIYSAFVNNGNMIKPYLEYKENPEPQWLVEHAFSEEAANIVRADLIQAVDDPYGTGHNVKVPGMTIGGKTGTAELKALGETSGDTLGWFDCFTADCDKSWIIISMAKNQGSTYLKEIIKSLFV